MGKKLVGVGLFVAIAATSAVKARSDGRLADVTQDGALPLNATGEALALGLTVCPSPNNLIVDGLNALGGNVFTNVESSMLADGMTLLTATAVQSRRVFNQSIGAADRPVGKITFKVGYAEGGFDRPLVCELRVQKI